MWIETIDERIFEIIGETDSAYIVREVLYKLDTPKLHYGEVELIDKGDVLWT